MSKSETANYCQMSQPHQSVEHANEALKKFYEKVEQARIEFNIADIIVIVKDSITYENGDVGQFMQHTQFGNESNGVSMAAYAYGQLQSEQREFLNKLATATKQI